MIRELARDLDRRVGGRGATHEAWCPAETPGWGRGWQTPAARTGGVGSAALACGRVLASELVDVAHVQLGRTGIERRDGNQRTT